MAGSALDEFVAGWDELDDPRTGNAGLHDFHELLFVALYSVLCGGQGAVDMALFAKSKEPFSLATLGASLRRVLTLANGAPSHDTFSRLFRQLDPEAFRAAFGRWRRQPVGRMSARCSWKPASSHPKRPGSTGVLALPSAASLQPICPTH